MVYVHLDWLVHKDTDILKMLTTASWNMFTIVCICHFWVQRMFRSTTSLLHVLQLLKATLRCSPRLLHALRKSNRTFYEEVKAATRFAEVKTESRSVWTRTPFRVPRILIDSQVTQPGHGKTFKRYSKEEVSTPALPLENDQASNAQKISRSSTNYESHQRDNAWES